MLDSGAIPCAAARDTAAPATPTGLVEGAVSRRAAEIRWQTPTDDVGVTGYDVLRDGVVIGSTSGGIRFVDSSVLAGTAYTYRVRARDGAGHLSAPSAPLVVLPSSVVFLDTFESGNLVAWMTRVGAVAVTPAAANVAAGGLRVSATGGLAYVSTLVTTFGTLEALVHVRTTSLAGQSDHVRRWSGCADCDRLQAKREREALLRRRTASRNGHYQVPDQRPERPVRQRRLARSARPRDDRWITRAHHPSGRRAAARPGRVATPRRQSGCSPSRRREHPGPDVPGRLRPGRSGPAADRGPERSVGASAISAKAVSGLQVNVAWSASADDVGVAGYLVFRNGLPVGATAGTGFVDRTVDGLASYAYTVRARDAAGNVSPRRRQRRSTRPSCCASGSTPPPP